MGFELFISRYSAFFFFCPLNISNLFTRCVWLGSCQIPNVKLYIFNTHTICGGYIHSFRSLTLRQVHSLFQSDFSTEYVLLLPLSGSNIQ
jgi:hypothetical protein